MREQFIALMAAAKRQFSWGRHEGLARIEGSHALARARGQIPSFQLYSHLLRSSEAVSN